MPQYGRECLSRVVPAKINGGCMKYLAITGVLLLGACAQQGHADGSGSARVQAFYAAPVVQQPAAATCADGFNASLDRLAAAMNLAGETAPTGPVSERATAYEGRISRF